MYDVYLYEDEFDQTGKLIHTTTISNAGDQILLSGVIDKQKNAVDVFEFTLPFGNVGYESVKPLRSRIEVVNTITNKIDFEGRITNPTGKMDQRGVFTRSYVSYGLLDFLNDSCQFATEIKSNYVPSTNVVDGKKYTVRRGDTLNSIAFKFGVTTTELIEWNSIKNPDLIFPGDVFYVTDPKATENVIDGVDNNIVPSIWLETILNVHNSQTEEYKHMFIGQVNVKNITGYSSLFIGYDSTFETIKKYLIEQFGGFLIARRGEDGRIYVDYLEEIGERSEMPIQIGVNLKSIAKKQGFENIITRLHPFGADIEMTPAESDAMDERAVKPRIGIASVNNGLSYIEDSDLVKEFGLINRTMNFTDLKSSEAVKARGDQYMEAQLAFLLSFNADVVELGLIDRWMELFKLYNSYPILVPALTSEMRVQIVGQKIDILRPQSPNLTFGSLEQSLTSFQLMMQQSSASVAKLERDYKESKRIEKERAAEQQKLLDDLNRQLEDAKAELTVLKSGSATTEQIESVNKRIEELEKQINGGV